LSPPEIEFTAYDVDTEHLAETLRVLADKIESDTEGVMSLQDEVIADAETGHFDQQITIRHTATDGRIEYIDFDE